MARTQKQKHSICHRNDFVSDRLYFIEIKSRRNFQPFKNRPSQKCPQKVKSLNIEYQTRWLGILRKAEKFSH